MTIGEVLSMLIKIFGYLGEILGGLFNKGEEETETPEA